jgi:excisionase family DNA binding protein
VTVHELPARPAATSTPDRYVSRAGLAEHLSVSVKTIDRIVREGCPSHTFGLRLRRFKVAEVERWLHRRAA